MKNCLVCDNAFTPIRKTSKVCPECSEKEFSKCVKHNVIRKGQQACIRCKVEESHKKHIESNQYEWIECPECSFRGEDLSTHVIKYHLTSPDDFKEKYKLSVLKSQKLCDRVKGSNNPGYNHGGKFSPFSSKFLYGDENTVKEVKRKAVDTRIKNDSYDTKLSFWLKVTNGDVKEAERMLAERQTTFSLEKCVEKHGIEEGTKIWEERQEKWQNTLNSKSYEELMEINAKKTPLFRNSTIDIDDRTDDRPGFFYILKLNSGFIKIGVSSLKDINERYGNSRKKFDVIETFYSDMTHCFQIEHILKVKYLKNVIDPSEIVSGFGWTETFKNISPDIFVEELRGLQDRDYVDNLFESTFA